MEQAEQVEVAVAVAAQVVLPVAVFKALMAEQAERTAVVAEHLTAVMAEQVA